MDELIKEVLKVFTGILPGAIFTMKPTDPRKQKG